MNIPASLMRAIAAALAAVVFGACSGTERPEALLDKAQASLAAADPKAAEIHLKNLLQVDESNTEARFLLAGIYRDANDLRSAEKEYRRARDLGFDRDKVTPPMLAAMYRLGLYQELVDDARGLALREPTAQADALTSVGHAQIALAQPAEAARTFAAALAARPDHVPAQVGALRARAVDDRAGARMALDALLQRNPDSSDALLLMGDLTLADGKAAPARALYDKVADLSPNDVETRAKLVALAIELKDLDGANARHAELRKLVPGAPVTHYLRALIDVNANRLEPAREAVLEALRLAPDYMPAVTLAAGLSLSLNALEQAERYARMSIERTPENPVGYRVLGATYLRMKAPDRALEAVRPALARTPPDPVALSIAGEASLKLNDPAAAAGYFERAAKANPADARSLAGLGVSHLASGQSARGIGELEQAVRLDSANLQADVALVMAHLRQRQFDKALAAVARMEQKAPKSPTPAGLRGAVLSAKGDVKGARAAFEKALAIDPTYFPAAANLAAFDLRENRPGDARQRYEAVLAKDPKQSQAAVALATLTARTGGPRDQVLGELKKAREANPDAVLPILATARYLIETNAPKDAIPMLQEAANRNPENTQILYVLAHAFIGSGQRAQAIGTWEKLLRIDPRAVLAQLRIGEAHLAGGDRDAALQSFRKAATIAPDAVEPQAGMAMVLQQQGKTDEAMRIAARLRASEKQKVAGTILTGDLLAAERKWSEASDRYRSAFAQQRSLQTGTKVHRALRAAGRDADAETFLRDWIRAEPANLRLRQFAGDSESVRGRWKPALEHYAVVLEKEPRNALALNNAAWALHELKDGRAMDHARRAWEAAPQSAPILDTYGVILSGSGDAKGLGLLRQAVELAPAQPRIRLHLAEALARAGDAAGARVQLDELLKTTPTGPVADSARMLQAKLAP